VVAGDRGRWGGRIFEQLVHQLDFFAEFQLVHQLDQQPVIFDVIRVQHIVLFQHQLDFFAEFQLVHQFGAVELQFGI
jgi:hypothetical protein